MNLLRNLLRLILLFSFCLFPLTAARTAEKAPQAVELKIGTILASNSSDDFDPKLGKMKNQLEVIKFRSYRLIKEESKKVPWQNSAVFEIPGGHSLVVTPQELRNKRLLVKVSLLAGGGPLLDTTVSLRNRGNFLLGGPAYEGGVLILSISAMMP